MTPTDIIRYRLSGQHLLKPAFSEATAVVHHLLAMQSQDYAGSKWSIGLRWPGATDAAVEKAIARKQIVRTWTIRGTLHWVAPEDVRWLNALVAPRLPATAATHLRQQEIDKALMKKSQQVFVKAMQGKEPLTGEEIQEALAAKGIKAAGQRLRYLLWMAAMDNVICMGNRRNAAFTYTLLDEWVPATKPFTREEALGTLALRYLKGRGPATLKDLAWWAGLTMADAKTALNSVASGLVQEKIGKEVYWMGEAKDDPDTSFSKVYLLPGFDEYMVGYTGRQLILDDEHVKTVLGAKNGLLSATIIVKGRVAGTWKRTIASNKLQIETNPFKPFNKTTKAALEAALNQYRNFIGKAREED